MKKLRLLALALSALALPAWAEIRQEAVTFVGVTNAVKTAAVTSNNRGILYRFRLEVSGAARTNQLVVADTDGSVIYSNAVTSGTTYVSFTNNPIPFVGLLFSTFGANSTAVTNTVTATFGR